MEIQSKEQFRKLQKQLNIIINKIEKEAVDNGEDISTEEFVGGIQLLRERLLDRKGLSIDVYNQLKEQFKEPEVDKEILENNKEVSSSILQVMEKLKEIEDKVSNQEIDDVSKKKIVEEVISKIPKPKDGIDGKSVDENKVIQTILSKIPKPKDGKPGKDGKSTILIRKEAIKKDIQEHIYKVIIDKALPEAIEKSKQEIILSPDMADMINRSIDMIGMPSWRKLAMGLQGQIDNIDISITNNITNSLVGFQKFTYFV